MADTVSRRGVLKATGSIGGVLAAGSVVPSVAEAQASSGGAPQDRFFRDDWFGEPWRQPEVIVLVHGALESGIVWYAWVPPLAAEFRVVRPDLPGCGLATVPAGFDWSFAGLAAYLASVLDEAGVDSAHIVGAKTGGPIAMQFAADFPARTRSLSVVSGPASVISIENPSPVPQRDRLGTTLPAASTPPIEPVAFRTPRRETVSAMAVPPWVPTLAKEYRVIRPDLPGCGLSTVPAGFDWSFAGLAEYIASVLDKAGVRSAHIVGAKTGGPIAMQFAADFPGRTRSLSVVSGPASVIVIENPSPVPQKDRLGSSASPAMIEYWTAMEKSAPPAGTAGLNQALSSFDLERDGVLQRIEAPSLIVTADRSALQSVEKVRQYQRAIPSSRLAVLRSDAYHLAVAQPEECLAAVLPFIREHAA